MSDEAALDEDLNGGVRVTGRTLVEVKRSGGVVGRTVTFVADSSRLAPASAARLVELLEETHYADVSESVPDSGAGRPDRFQYELTIEAGSSRRHFRFAEGSSEHARFTDLIAFVIDTARSERDTEGKG